MGNRYWLARNLLNAGGMSSFAAGALSVMQQSPMSRTATSHMTIIATIVRTTIHIQDLCDQAGDKKIGRRTLPLVIGDRATQATIDIAVMLWSVAVPAMNDAGHLESLPILRPGVVVAGGTALLKGVEDDVTTFLLYNLWLMAIYVLPLTAHGHG